VRADFDMSRVGAAVCEEWCSCTAISCSRGRPPSDLQRAPPARGGNRYHRATRRLNRAPVPGLRLDGCGTLWEQATLQTGTQLFGLASGGLCALRPSLPSPSAPRPGRHFFDFGRVIPALRGAASGASTIFGLVEVDETFHALWAHDLAVEKRALVDFLSTTCGGSGGGNIRVCTSTTTPPTQTHSSAEYRRATRVGGGGCRRSSG
jgi:hypothetical protein